MISPIENYQGLNVTFQTTEECNLACTYCYEVNKQPKVLPLEYAKKFIRLLVDDNSFREALKTKDQDVTLSGLILDFIGGDSLINPKQIEDIITYFMYYTGIKQHDWKDTWRASISTNGTLFTKEAKSFMTRFKRNLSVGISIDGCPEIHDKNRKFKDGTGSMAAILKDWDWYYDWCEGYATTKSTLNKESIPYLSESIKFMHEELKLKYINMNFIFENMYLTDEDLALLDLECEKCINYIFKHSNDLYVSMFGREIGCSDKLQHNKTDWNSCWCGGGIMPCVTPSGKIYPCFRFTTSTVEAGIPELILGDVNNGWTHLETALLLRDQTRQVISPPECFDCDVEITCAWCIGGVYNATGQFFRPTNLCKVKHVIAKWSDKYWDMYDANRRGGVDNSKSN